MSLTARHATTRPAGRTVEIHSCEHCQSHYPHSGQHTYGFNRRFCTWQCKYRAKADDLFDTLQSDHRYCFSCFRELKTILAPTLSKRSAERGKSIPDFVTGRQEYRSHTQQDFQNTARRNESVHEYGSTTLESRMGCSCPANHHTTVVGPVPGAELTKGELLAHTKRLDDALAELDDRGKHRTDYNTDALFDYVRTEKTRGSTKGRDDRDIMRDGLAYAIRESP